MKVWFTRLRTGWLVDVPNGQGEYMTTAGPFTTFYGARQWAKCGLSRASQKWARRDSIQDRLGIRRRGCAWREARAEIDRTIPLRGLRPDVIPFEDEWPTMYEQYRPERLRSKWCRMQWPCMSTHKTARGVGCGRPA